MNLRYEVEGRNGYYGIDEYNGDSCLRCVETFRTRKQAELICREFNMLAREINELEKKLSHPWVKVLNETSKTKA